MESGLSCRRNGQRLRRQRGPGRGRWQGRKAQGRWGSNRGLDGKGRSRGRLGSPRGATRIEAGRILAAVDDRHGRQASRQAEEGLEGSAEGRRGLW